MIKSLKCKFQKLLAATRNYFWRYELIFVVEQANWVIKQIAHEITKNLTDISLNVVECPYGIRNSIVHFGSINTFLGSDTFFRPHKSNKVIVTWYHVSPEDKRIALVRDALKYVDIWHTA